MSFFKSPSPLARLRRNSLIPSFGASKLAVDKENVASIAISDPKLSKEESQEKSVLEASNHNMETKLGKFQAQVETTVTSDVNRGPRGPMLGRKTIRGLEMDLASKRQELIRLQQELQRSEEELANALQDKEKLEKQLDSDKSACEDTITHLRDEIDKLKLDHAESDKERAASFKKQIADLQGDHQKEVLALQHALKVKEEAENKKASNKLLYSIPIRSPFHYLMNHEGSDDDIPNITNTDSKVDCSDFLSADAFEAPHSAGPTDIATTTTALDFAGNTEIAVTTIEEVFACDRVEI